ncbi:hypothetical protein [Streptomyces sp. NPDC002785]|uniref:hypothetical protein n=1 Tax=Streptomyces sp. NPDC002785 TaxID=3154543 RepID=UPI003319FCF0
MGQLSRSRALAESCAHAVRVWCTSFKCAPVPGRAADFKSARGTGISGLVIELDAALPEQGLTELMEQANRPVG